MGQNKESQNNSLLRNQPDVRQEEEIDLVQIWLVLLKRKYLIAGICFLCALIGVAIAFTMPLKYAYKTSIEIGTTLTSTGSGVESTMIEPPEVVLAKIKESYIPRAIVQMMEKNVEQSFITQAKNPKKSNLIVLTTRGTADLAGPVHELHSLIIEPLLEDHLQVINVPRRDYEISVNQQKIQLEKLQNPRIFSIKEKEMLIQINAAKMKLSELDDQKQLLLSQDKRLTETQALLRKQADTVEANLAQVYASRPKATEEVGTEAQAMTLLMINSQIEQNEKRLAHLQERLNITLENQKETLQKKVAENRRAWSLQKERISKLQSQFEKLKISHELELENQKNNIYTIENKIDGLRETRLLSVATRSSRPTGPRKLLILLLSGVVGLMGGIMMAFFAEFASNARQRMDQY